MNTKFWSENMKGREHSEDGRPRRRWEENIRMDLRKIGWEGVNRIHLSQYKGHWRAVVNTVMNLRVA
jgi:hypothetical protein